MARGHTTQRLNKSCILLTAIAGIERFAFKGVASNLVTYLTDVMKLSNSSAAKMVNTWCGLTFLMPLLVAPIADAYYHKYSTITASSFLYLVGLAALTSTAVVRSRHEGNKRIPSSFLSSSLCLISLAQGGYNPSLQAFGADQLDDDEELPCSKEDNKPNKKTVFFQCWYFGVCSGSLLDSESKTKKPLNGIVQSIKAYALKGFRSKITLPQEESEVKELELQEKPLCRENRENVKEMNENSKSSTVMEANSKVVLRLITIWTLLLMFAVIFQQPATFFTKQEFSYQWHN
ncbi:hypothetical protein K1719_008690 [Acacia pycnantha]|nr:hypothetical protein K1719_008690 [Acacia pycnantha]